LKRVSFRKNKVGRGKKHLEEKRISEGVLCNRKYLMQIDVEYRGGELIDKGKTDAGQPNYKNMKTERG